MVFSRRGFKSKVCVRIPSNFPTSTDLLTSAFNPTRFWRKIRPAGNTAAKEVQTFLPRQTCLYCLPVVGNVIKRKTKTGYFPTWLRLVRWAVAAALAAANLLGFESASTGHLLAAAGGVLFATRLTAFQLVELHDEFQPTERAASWGAECCWVTRFGTFQNFNS